jgi:Na+-transporting NADH:ubiquinone oxidoreductase subunit B
MKFVRDLLDKMAPQFMEGGKQERLYPLYEAQDTFLFTPGEVAHGGTHVRDAIDLKRLMITVVVAMVPCIFMAMYNTGYQANKIIQRAADPMTYDANGDSRVTQAELPERVLADYEAPKDSRPSIRSLFVVMDTNSDGYLDENESRRAVDEGVLVPAVVERDWTMAGVRYKLMDLVGVKYDQAGTFSGNFYRTPVLLLFCLIHGALYFLPVYIVTMAAGGTCEAIFSIIRRHEINEGFLVSGMLFPLTLPPTIPLWQVAVGIIFGIVIGKEIFGGTGRNFLNPALTARAFLYFAYPAQISGSKVWAAVDGYSGATALGSLANARVDSALVETASSSEIREAARSQVTEAITQLPVSFDGATVISEPHTYLDFFWGNIHGSMGETSTFCCLLGALILIATGIGSWRIMAGCVIGLVGLSALIWGVGGEEPIFNVAPQWHLVIGGFAFGTVFMATDPVSAAMTNNGRWIYGILIGAVTVMVRVINPAFPEGIMLAILFGNVCAPVIDYWVVSQNIKRRLARNES